MICTFFSPGDATRYRVVYAPIDPANTGVITSLFYAFGVGTNTMVAFVFPFDTLTIDYSYFVKKFGCHIDDAYSRGVAFLILHYLLGTTPYRDDLGKESLPHIRDRELDFSALVRPARD